MSFTEFPRAVSIPAPLVQASAASPDLLRWLATSASGKFPALLRENHRRRFNIQDGVKPGNVLIQIIYTFVIA